MPSPGRRLPPPPAHTSRSSPSYHRHRSPDRRRMGAPRPDSGSHISPSRTREVRRPSEHVSSRDHPDARLPAARSHLDTRSPSSRSHPDARSRPREGRDALPLKRPSLPETLDPGGRSYSASTSTKRKASPKHERDMVRPLDRAEPLSISRLPVPPRKIMRSSSPELPPFREVLHPSVDSSSRIYSHSSAVISSTRHYSGINEVKPKAHSYTITTAPRYTGNESPLEQRYSNPSRGYVEPTTATESRGYVPDAQSTASRGTFRRSDSEERLHDRPSAQKRTTGHMTSSRFGGMRDSDEPSLSRSDSMAMNPATLSGYVFNINNEPDPKYNRDQHNIVRKIVNPESLQVVRRPAPRLREWKSEAEDLYCPMIARRAQTSHNGEGQRPIFERDEIIHQQRVVAEEGHSRPRERSPVPQVARYVSPEPYHEPPNSRDSHNGQSRSSHSRAIPSSSRTAPTSRSAYYEEEPAREYRPREHVKNEPRDDFESREPSRPVRLDDLRHDLRHAPDLRQELEVKRVAKHSPDRARESTRRRSRDGEPSRSGARARSSRAGSESDLRVHINEKRRTRSRERGYDRERPTERRSERSREHRHSPSGERRRHSDSRERRERGHRESPPRYREQPKPWEVDPEFVPRGRAYFEHDNREEMAMMRGRGIMHMRPGLVYRGRGIRRPYRGGPFIPGGFVMGHGLPRGFPPPRHSSPQWEHDMFDKLDADTDLK